MESCSKWFITTDAREEQKSWDMPTVLKELRKGSSVKRSGRTASANWINKRCTTLRRNAPLQTKNETNWRSWDVFGRSNFVSRGIHIALSGKNLAFLQNARLQKCWQARYIWALSEELRFSWQGPHFRALTRSSARVRELMLWDKP